MAYLRKPYIVNDLGITSATLWQWIKAGYYPQGVILNPGSGREIVAWPEEVHEAWKASRPARFASHPERLHKGRRAKAVARQEAQEQEQQQEPVRRITRPR
jgi:predicted DNA-binding transcriptional regulator AlpA